MPMTTPSNTRAELRDWYYDNDKMCWFGNVFNDRREVYDDGFELRIHPRELEEVNELTEVMIFTMKNGDRYFAFYNHRRGDTNG